MIDYASFKSLYVLLSTNLLLLLYFVSLYYLAQFDIYTQCLYCIKDISYLNFDLVE